jgi:hypothetical protein
MERKANGGLIGGLILLFVGIVALIGQFVPDALGELFGTFLLLGLGLVFLAIGIITREGGWFIPGGILTGLGAGTGLITSSLGNRLSGDEGGWFLLVFAAGWLLIPIMTAIFARETHWWALIPAGIIGLVGLAVLYGGVFMDTLEWVGKLWPIALIIAGGLLLWKVGRGPREEPEKPVEKTV